MKTKQNPSRFERAFMCSYLVYECKVTLGWYKVLRRNVHKLIMMIAYDFNEYSINLYFLLTSRNEYPTANIPRSA